MSDPSPEAPAHPHEAHVTGLANRLNWLRAAVLGANDGIVSTAGLVSGVAGATTDRTTVLIAGLAGLVAGALSMAGGEFVSVSAQTDTEAAALDRERWELEHMPEMELDELAGIYESKGLDPALARTVAVQLTEHDALGAHAEAELGIDADERTNPWAAAWSSFVAFAIGSTLPLLAIVLPPLSLRLPVTILSVVLALAGTGALSARLGDAPRRPAMVRNVLVGLVAMTITFGVGSLVGAGVG